MENNVTKYTGIKAFCNNMPLWGKLIGKFATVCTAAAAVYAFFKDKLETDLTDLITNPAALFTILAICIGVTVVFFCLANEYVKLKSQKNDSPQIDNNPKRSMPDEKSDSIMKILDEASVNDQYREVVRIGTALSDVLWTTSRKELRIKVGKKVRSAARQLANTTTNEAEKREAKRNEAHVLIEDIGNTMMDLKHEDVDKAIKSIRDGVKIANKFGFHFEDARGHRNLANCYALKKDNDRAREELKEAEKARDKIIEEKERVMIEFDIIYAYSKIYRNEDQKKAITELQNCLEIYEKRDATEKLAFEDRVVKIYREMGVIYSEMQNKEDEAIDAYEKGLQRAKDRQNHEEIVRCCTGLIKIYTKNDTSGMNDAIERYINTAEKHINTVDAGKYIEEFREAKEAWEGFKKNKKSA